MSFSRQVMRRCMSTVARAVQCSKPGSLSIESATVPSAGASQVVVKMLAAPISEYDAAVISGRAGPFSGTAGNEGVGVVTSVGPGVNGIAANDWVVPSAPGVGTFAEYLVADANSVQVIPSDISVADAALVGGTGTTALRLLSDFGAGECIIQNAANSPVGQAVIQIAKAKGIRTINIIPDGPEDGNAVQHLQDLGGDIVVTESYAGTTKFTNLISDFPTPSLGINAAGGKAATTVARTIADGSTMVTYGGSAPIVVPTSVLVGKGINLAGFSLARFNANASAADRAASTIEVAKLVQDGALKAHVTEKPFEQVLDALESYNSQDQAVTATLITM